MKPKLVYRARMTTDPVPVTTDKPPMTLDEFTHLSPEELARYVERVEHEQRVDRERRQRIHEYTTRDVQSVNRVHQRADRLPVIEITFTERLSRWLDATWSWIGYALFCVIYGLVWVIERIFLLCDSEARDRVKADRDAADTWEG